MSSEGINSCLLSPFFILRHLQHGTGRDTGTGIGIGIGAGTVVLFVLPYFTFLVEFPI